MPPKPASMDEAREIVRRLGRPEMEFVSSFTSALYWVMKNEDGSLATRNGSAFFLKTPETIFGVTAAHIIEGENSWREHCAAHGSVPLRLSGWKGTSLPFYWDDRQLDINTRMDIATFRIDAKDLKSIDRIAFEGLQSPWPPEPPEKWEQVTYGGFAGIETRQLSREAVEFGFVSGSGLATSVSETTISTLIERAYAEPIGGVSLPPANFRFGGISGCPMISVTERLHDLRLYGFAGVVVSGPNPSGIEGEAISDFELIAARRARFLRPDGSLDHALWDTLSPPRP